MEQISFTGEATAPGKFIISGEHSAVYGHPVLLMAINRKLTCKFTITLSETYKESSLVVISESGEIYDSKDHQQNKNEGRLLEYALKKFTDVPPFSLLVRVKSDIPIGAGLGSSAAYAASLSACIALSLVKITNQNQEFLDDIIFDFTNCMERFQHGKPSGCDAACIITGGTISY